MTKIVKSTFWPPVARANALIMSHFYLEPSQTGFKVDSPVKKPRASEMARLAPPYTDCAREEPWEGGSGPLAVGLEVIGGDQRGSRDLPAGVDLLNHPQGQWALAVHDF